MLSICVPLLNRSRVLVGEQVLELFPKCLESLRDHAPPGGEVVVADFDSEDRPLGSGWAQEVLGPAVPLRVVEVSRPFSRGRGLNVAAGAARGDALLFLDADMLLCPEVVTYAGALSVAGAAYFPVCWSLGNPEGTYGWWRKEGWGNCAMSRETFDRVGGWTERDRWGKEDVMMRDRLREVGVPIVRERVDGFIHQWHPPVRRHAATT